MKKNLFSYSMLNSTNVRYLFLIFLLCFSASMWGESEEVIKQISDNIYKIEEITIDTDLQEIRFPAEFNMENGLIELLLCGRKGKLHESVLKTAIIPSHLQVALLLLDFNYGNLLEFQGDPRIPEGDSLLIKVTWQNEEGEQQEARIEQLAYNKPKQSPMQHTHWIFTGSRIVDGNYMADIEESIITTYHDPYSIIDNPLTTGGDDTVYEVNSSIVPAKGTKAEIMISPYNNNNAGE